MDAAEFFDGLPEWEEMSEEQRSLLDRLMAIADSRGLAAFDGDAVLAIQGLMLRTDREAELTANTIKQFAETPSIASDIAFI